MQNLSEKAMLVRLSISQWTAKKYDRKVSQKVADDYGASRDAGRYNKVLVAKDAIKKIQKVANEARTFHYENTLPWSDDGARILPSANFDAYSQKLREYRVKFETTCFGFFATYRDLVEQAKIDLNSMFNAADYPEASDLPRRYGFDIVINPLPDADDFRVSLNFEDVSKIQADITQRVKESTQRAMQDLWDRLYKNVSHMADKLREKDTIFRDSLVNNLCDLCSLLPRLNITGDTVLERMRQEIETKLCDIAPQDLRDDKATRRVYADRAKAVADAMAGYMGGN